MTRPLSSHQEELLDEIVKTGSYADESQAIDEALELLLRRNQLEQLRQKLLIGLNSGDPEEFSEELMDRLDGEAEEAILRGELPSPDVTP